MTSERVVHRRRCECQKLTEWRHFLNIAICSRVPVNLPYLNKFIHRLNDPWEIPVDIPVLSKIQRMPQAERKINKMVDRKIWRSHNSPTSLCKFSTHVTWAKFACRGKSVNIKHISEITETFVIYHEYYKWDAEICSKMQPGHISVIITDVRNH